MNTIKRFTFPKEEHLCLKNEIDLLFEHPDLRLNRFPLLFLIRTHQNVAPVRILISVPKKKIKRAVKRNLIRRRIREAYRMNKHLLMDVLPENVSIDLAILYMDVMESPYHKIEKAVISLLNDTGKRISEIH